MQIGSRDLARAEARLGTGGKAGPSALEVLANVDAVEALQESWRAQTRSRINPRSDAAAWRVIDVLPAHPVITLPVAVAATGRSKVVVNQALTHLEDAEVLIRLPGGQRNRAWEAAGLLDLLAGLDDAGPPPR